MIVPGIRAVPCCVKELVSALKMAAVMDMETKFSMKTVNIGMQPHIILSDILPLNASNEKISKRTLTTSLLKYKGNTAVDSEDKSKLR